MSNNINTKIWDMRSQRQRVSPFPNYMSMEIMCGFLAKYVGISLKRTMAIYQDRVAAWYVDKKSFEMGREKLVQLIKKQPTLYNKFVQVQHKWGKLLTVHAKISGKKVNGKTSPARLFEMWKKFENIYKHVYGSYGSVWIIEDGLNNELLEIIKKRIKNESKAAHILDIMTREPAAMVARIEERARLKLSSEISKRLAWKKQVLRGAKFITDSRLRKFINQHENSYFWVTRDYEDPILNFETIVEKISNDLKANPSREFKQILLEDQRISKEQHKFIRNLKLTFNERALFNAMHDIAFLKELRKRYVSEALYYFDPVLMEIAKRGDLTLKQVRFLRTKDVEDLLLHGKDLTQEVNKRILLSVWFNSNRGTTVATTKKAEVYKKAFLSYSNKTKEFSGMSVSPGKAQGPVRIVMNPDDCNKVKRGDIIVSVQVVPSFSAAIHRAAGLICDGGHGITTHPAILAREAGIPAIIQTRFARHVLKDGDIVEVDGYKGIAKKLN